MKRRNLNGNHWSDMYICVHPVMAAPLNNEGEKNTSDNRSIVHESFPKRYLIEKDQWTTMVFHRLTSQPTLNPPPLRKQQTVQRRPKGIKSLKDNKSGIQSWPHYLLKRRQLCASERTRWRPMLMVQSNATNLNMLHVVPTRNFVQITTKPTSHFKIGVTENRIALSVQCGLELHHVDITTAFLSETLQKEVYMNQPMGYGKKENSWCAVWRRALMDSNSPPSAGTQHLTSNSEEWDSQGQSLMISASTS